MTFEQFKHVLEVSKTGSINQAANNLFSSQAALSISIKNLEQELGQSIFIRNNRGIQLTSFGRDFISYITPICAQIAQLQQVCNNQTQQDHMSLSVASNGYRFIAPICAKLYEKYKTLGIHIHHLDGIGDETMDYVSNHQVEVGIVRIWDCYRALYNRQFAAKKLEFFHLTNFKICISVGRGNPLYTMDRDFIALDELEGFPMVVHTYLHTGPYADIFSRLNIPHNRNRIIAGSRAIIYDTLECTDAFYVSSHSTKGYENPGLPTQMRSFTLKDCAIQSEIGWIKHEDYTPTSIAKEFIREITQMFQTL